MSNLSDLLPAGAGAKSATFTASGTLPSGQVVILNTDGTVSSVTQSSSSTGTPVNFNAGSSRTFMETAVVYHPVQDKTVFFYCDSGSSNYGKAIVGTVSGTSISFSGATEFTWESGTVGEIAAVYDSNIDRIILVYENASNYTEAKVITVSGNSLSTSGASGIGGVTNYEDNSVCFDSSSNKTIFAASSQTNSGYGHARVLTATVGSVSSGTVVTFQSNSVRLGQAVYDSNADKTVIFYGQSGTGGKAIVGTVSGTNITFGTAATFSTAGSDAYNVAAAYDSDNNKVVVAYRTALPANDGNANVGTVSGTDITFGSAVQYLATSADHTAIVYDATAKKMVIAFCDDNADGELVEGTVSGDSISFTSPTTYQSGGVSDLDKAGAYDSTAGKTVFSYQLDSNFDNYAFVHQSAATDSANFVGITDEAIANAATGSVVVEGGAITNTSLIPALVRAGTAATFANSNSAIDADAGIAMAYDSSNNKFTLFYYDKDNSNRNSVIVGTVSGDTITYGTSVSQTSNLSTYKASAYDANAGKVVFSYADASDANKGKAVVGTISGTTISFGTVVQYTTSAGIQCMTYDSTNQKIVIIYRDVGNSSYGTAIVGTVSGTSISFGTPAVFESANIGEPAVTFDANAGTVVAAYYDVGNSYYGTAVVGTVSGTSISFGTPVVFNTATTQYMSLTYDSTAQKVVLSYQDVGNSSYGTAVVGTVSGTSISFGSATVFNTGNTQNTQAQYDSTDNKTIIAYRDISNSQRGAAVAGTVSGTSISFGSSNFFTSVGNVINPSTNGIIYDSNAQRVVTSYGYSGAGAPVQSDAVTLNENSNLTIGSTYYVQNDGSLSTTSSSVTAGKALSSTTLLLKG